MNKWECGLYSGVGNLLTFVSFCDKNAGVRVICGVGYSPENTVALYMCTRSDWTIKSKYPPLFTFLHSCMIAHVLFSDMRHFSLF